MTDPVKLAAPHGLLSRYLRLDNKHIWLTFSVAAPCFALSSFGPLVARRMTRFTRFAAAFADETWTLRGNVVSPLNFSTLPGCSAYLYAVLEQEGRAQEEAEADRDYQMIKLTCRYLEATRFEHPVVLTWLLRAMELKDTATVPQSADEPISMSERIAIAITKRQFSTNYLWLIREGLERDMRQRGISEHDIDRTVLYLAGALQDNDLRRILRWGRVYAWSFSLAVVITNAGLPWWYPACMITPLALINLCWWQEHSLPVHIHNKRAVAEMLRDRWSTGED